MAARIVNHLKPDEEGTLYGTVAEARAALSDMVKRFEARPGWTVTETEPQDEGPWYSVTDDEGRPVGIFYVAL